MPDLTCTDVEERAAERALGILTPAESGAVDAHLESCPDCSAEIASLRGIGARLLTAVPGTEPPLGFDRRVLARVRPGRRRRWRTSIWLASTAAVAAAVLALTLGLTLGRGSGRTHTYTNTLTATFHQANHTVGEVYAYDDPDPWVTMKITGSVTSGRVTCELVHRDRSVTALGTFVLRDGRGEWGAPAPGGTRDLTEAVLVGSDGQVVAQAWFGGKMSSPGA